MHVCFELGLGHARLLEVHAVVLAIAATGCTRTHQVRELDLGRQRQRLAERNAQHRYCAKQVGPHQGCVPSDGPPPVVPDDHCLLFGLCREQPAHGADDVTDDVRDRVSRDVLWLTRSTVAPHIQGHRAITCACQGSQLMPPRVPRLGEAVTHHDERACTLLDVVNLDAVRGDFAVFSRAHGRAFYHVAGAKDPWTYRCALYSGAGHQLSLRPSHNFTGAAMSCVGSMSSSAATLIDT